MSDGLKRTRLEIREWASQPPRRSAAAAREAVIAAIEPRPQVPGWRLVTAASVVAVVLFTMSLLQPAPRPGEQRIRAGQVSATGRSEDGPLMVYQLASGARLYLVLTAQGLSDARESTDGEETEG